MSIHVIEPKILYLAALLYESIEDINLSAVQMLLIDKKANPNILVPRKGISPFHLAVGFDNEKYAFEVTSIILQQGGDPNVRSLDGLTPVHISAAWGRLDILKLLIHNGGNPYVKDANEMDAVNHAYYQNQKEIHSYLLKNCPAFDLSVLPENEVCDLVLHKVLINNKDITGEYKIDDEYIYDQTTTLPELPETESEEYVLNWIDNNIATREEKSELKLEDNHSSLDETSSLKDRFAKVTVRKKRIKRKTPTKKSDNFEKGLPIIGNSVDRKTNNKINPHNIHYKEHSRESGIITMLDSSYASHFKTFHLSDDEAEKSDHSEAEEQSKTAQHINIIKPICKDTSSDYFTCTELSQEVSNIFEQNIFDISSETSALSVPNSSIFTDDKSVELHNKNIADDVVSEGDKTFVSVSEVYKYMDPEEDVVLYEKRLLVAPPMDLNDSIKSGITSLSSKASSLPQNFDYDTDCLRKELTKSGFQPGPITKTTKRIYLKKLYKLKKYSTVKPVQESIKRVYSKEMEKTIKNPDWLKNLNPYKELDFIVSNQFHKIDPSRKWREGSSKSSFNYLLLDPRITENLPCRADTLDREELWKTFLPAIFYVGKGKRSRPYAHLYEAVGLYRQGIYKSKNQKLQHILDIWSSNAGVICLHIFQNVIPVEAYTREAAMICALKLENLKNLKSGDFYGTACTWSMSQKCMFGVFLLFRAMNIFLQEGERQLSPTDID